MFQSQKLANDTLTSMEFIQNKDSESPSQAGSSVGARSRSLQDLHILQVQAPAMQ
jgi:hypothetical protein